MKHKLGICIPYRNRKSHLDKLIPELSQYLKKKGIDHKFYVGHQVDDKLFNRGAMKNIAAHYAFSDGCDYVAWHDVDMIPHDNKCDYSYPKDTPIHIATKLSKYDFTMGYDQYFGGVVLFNKEQAEKTNGYSNDYWDWGQEDDDLFWRSYYEGYTTGKVFDEYTDRLVAKFNGNNSFLSLPSNRDISSSLHQNHTVSILFKADQQQEKVPIWLVGDTDRKFIEYPIIRKDGSWTWGISFNNSRAVTMVAFDKEKKHNYNWAKRFENLWTWVTMSFNEETKSYNFFINDEIIAHLNGLKVNSEFPIGEELMRHQGQTPFMLGFCNHSNVYYKGEIAEVKIFNKHITDFNETLNDDDLILHYDFSKGNKDLVNDEYELTNNNVEFENEEIRVIENIIPFRREGAFLCLPHVDEGYVNGKWAKGETTARNERRFVTEMQQRKIDYKNEGLNKILDVMDIENVDETLYPNTMFINVKMK